MKALIARALQIRPLRLRQKSSAPLVTEPLEQRTLLSGTTPDLTVVGPQVLDEGDLLSLTDLGTFTDDSTPATSSTIGLDPSGFTSSGPFAPATNVVFDTDTMTSTGGASVTGIDVGGVAVFVFDSISIPAGVTISATGSRPIALLSQSTIQVDGTIDVSANGSTGGAGGGDGGTQRGDNGGLGFGAAATGGGVAGDPFGPQGASTASLAGGGGGAHGGAGGQGESTSSTGITQGGQAYGDLSVSLSGGSGGGVSNQFSANYADDAADGGGGGGAIELGATGAITISSTGSILATGDSGLLQTVGGMLSTGGAGAGGGILIHGDAVVNAGLIDASGGDELRAPSVRVGGSGGGGRVLVVHSTTGGFTNSGTVDISAGQVDAGQTGFGQTAADLTGAVGDFSTIAVTPVSTVQQFTYQINWGDGSALETGIADIDVTGTAGVTPYEGSFDGSHTYADNGLYTVTVTLTDIDGEFDVQTFTVTVENVDPSITSSTLGASAFVGDAVNLAVAFEDAGFDNPLTPSVESFTSSTIDWGDGTVTTGAGLGLSVTQGSAGVVTTGSIATSHTYAVPGVYDVTVTVSDDDGGLDTFTSQILVSGVAEVGGQLIVVGTNGDDIVAVSRQGNQLVVTTDFMPTVNTFSFSLASINEVEAYLLDGNDVFFATSNVNTPLFADGGAGSDILYGGRGIDILLGGEGDDWVFGDNGNDLLSGGSGNDVIAGMNGSDALFGGEGDDWIFGMNGRDLLVGGEGIDVLSGGNGKDLLIGGNLLSNGSLVDIDADAADQQQREDWRTELASLGGCDNPIELFETPSVEDDETIDFLFGGRGRDWLLFGTGDVGC